MDENVFKIVKDIIIPLAGIVIPLIFSTYKAKSSSPFFLRKYLTFKKIRREYLKDKIDGYYFFQEYMGVRIPKEQMDFILNSEDAFSIMKIIKTTSGKYEFKNGKFYSSLKKRNYILPIAFYLISDVFILFPIVFFGEILKKVELRSFVFSMILIFCIFGPLLINSIQKINEIKNTRYLETLTKEKNKKRIRKVK